MITSKELLQQFNPDIFFRWNFESLSEDAKIQRLGIYELSIMIDEYPEKSKEEIYQIIGEKYNRSPEAVKHWYYRNIL